MASEDDLIEAAPCPSCRSPLTVAVSDLGHLVECPGCGTQFRARRPGPAADEPRPSRPSSDEPPPSRRRDRDRDDEVEDLRPRPPRGRGRFDDLEGERDRDPYPDYLYRDDRRRKGTPGSLIAIAVMNFIYAGLLLICGVLGVIGLAFVGQLQAQGGPAPNMALEIPLVFGYFATGLVMLFAGILTLRRQGWGLCVTAIVLGAVLFVLGLVNGVMSMQQVRVGAPGEEVGMVCGVAFLVIFWLGYLVTNGILLAKSARHFR